MAINFTGFVYDEAGAAKSGLTVNLYDKNTTTPVRATTTTDASGKWSFAHGTDGEFDVEIVNGAQNTRLKHDTSLQVEEISLADNNKILFGSGADASIYFDSTRLIVGEGVTTVRFAGAVEIIDNAALWFGADGDVAILYSTASNALSIDLPTGGTDVIIDNGGIGDTGAMFLNDGANTDMTIGFTINQAANDDDILAFKSSDVNHGMTAIKEFDTYASFSKADAASGGLLIESFSEGVEAFKLQPAGTNGDTNKNIGATGVINFDVYTKAGTSRTATGQNSNLMVIQNATATTFIFDAEGSAHADVEWTTYDQEDDLAAVRDLEVAMLPDRFGQALAYNREAFERLGIVGENSWREQDGQTHAMINFTRLAMLHHGALVQVADRLSGIEDGLKVLGAATL